MPHDFSVGPTVPSKDLDNTPDKEALKQQDPGTLKTGGVIAVDDSWLVEGVAKTIPEVLERKPLTPASVDADLSS